MDTTKMDMFKLLDGMKPIVFGNVKPDGSPEFPAKSCKEIQMCFPEATSGNYWLDPNEGSKHDAVAVHCNFDRVDGVVETCVAPTTTFDIKNMKTIKPTQDNKHEWVVKHVMGDRKTIEYEASGSQWRNLFIGQKTAHQNVTYHCKNSAAHRTMNGEQKPFVQLLSKNRHVLHTEAAKEDRVTVVSDACYLADGQWHEAVLDYTTKDFSRLPIRDIGVLGSGAEDEQFSLTVGQVCFSA